MRRLASTLLLLVVVSSAALADERAVATTLRSHTLSSADGSELSLATLEGEVIIVNFWASWCGPCRKELAVFDRWSAELADQGVSFAAINIDGREKNARRLVRRDDLSLPVYYDGVDGLAAKLDLPYLPCTYVLDAAGNIVLISPGVDDAKLNEIRSTALAMAGGRSTDASAGLAGGK
jgi:thiol-disulfide isomerase/thioredoxin